MIKYCWMQIKMLLDVALQVNIYLVYIAYTIICVVEVQKCNTTQLEKIILSLLSVIQAYSKQEISVKSKMYMYFLVCSPDTATT